MSIKNILMVSIILSAFIVGVILYPYIIYWIHTKEGDVTINAFIVLMIVIAMMGLCAANANVVYERWKEKELFDEVADKVYERKNQITVPEMKRNAESLLTDDEKAMLYVVGKNPVYKVAQTGERLITNEEIIHIENNRIGLFVDKNV